jgi:hypothetical protein
MFILRSLLVVFLTFGGALGLAVALGSWFGIGPFQEPWKTIYFLVLCGVLCALTLRLTRFMKSKPAPVMSEAEMERLGLIREETYEAKRSLTVEEFEDEGPHVFLELVDGRVLCLNGQYLDESVYGETGAIMKQDVPTFPCAQFRVKQRKDGNFWWGCDIVPLSPYVAPEAAFPSYRPGDWEALGEPSDGEILSRSFDELKSFLAKRETKSKRK